ncbi:MAG TPA: OmpH family outer membrane protein [Candidatus Baltobacteraceae bacterium]|nr:OmpH family outer membrane protein [Candidatus Baltobacteraceae bacterium]
MTSQRERQGWGLVLAVALTAMIFAAPGITWAAQPAALKIGVVDIQGVLEQSQRGQATKQKLNQERAGRQKELEGKQQEIQKLQADFEKQAPVLSDTAKREKSEAIQRKAREVQRLFEDASRDFEKRVREAEMDVTREIFAVIQEYGKDQGYSVVLERSTVVYVSSAVDLTAEIVKRFDAKGK